MTTQTPQAHVENVCRIGQGAATCAYLTLGNYGWLCGKEDAGIRAAIDVRRAEITAQGDNCSGPPDYEGHNHD